MAEPWTDVAAPRAAATVMLVRDSADGVEVFMLRRVASMKFAPRMWVFPGGSVDPRDADPELPWAGPSPAEWASALGAPDEATARELVIAAVREVFEECGVLLAGPGEDSVVADLRSDPSWTRDREALLSHQLSFAQMLIARGLVLRSDLLVARGHWITPEFEPRRYDTRFFAARVPEGQLPDDLTTEADHADWTEAMTLLRHYAEGEALLLPPTVVCCEQVAAAPTAAEFLAAPVTVAPVMPRPVEVDGVVMMRSELPV
jgi:8-oxo-dGTP pyrophosphatase MutT (NUDIX family)